MPATDADSFAALAGAETFSAMFKKRTAVERREARGPHHGVEASLTGAGSRLKLTPNPSPTPSPALAAALAASAACLTPPSVSSV